MRPPAWAGARLRAAIALQTERALDHAFAPRADAASRFAAETSGPELEGLVWYRHQKEVVTGLSRRDPFLDVGLVRFVTALPPEWLVHGSIRRGLFREAIAGLVPESLRMRPNKAGFEEGFTRFVRGAGGFEAFRDLAFPTALADLGFVDPRAFARAYDELARGPLDSYGWGDVWPAIAVEGFVRSRSASWSA